MRSTSSIGRITHTPARPEDAITPAQYKLGWELVSTGHTVQQVLSATGLTRPQLAWLTKVGSDSMPSYHRRLAEQVARIRSRGQEAADAVGAGAVEALKRSTEITGVAQGMVRQILAAHLKMRVNPALKAIQDGTGTSDDYAALAMPAGIRETLKTLREYASFEATAKAFRIVFDSPHQARDPLAEMPREVKMDLSGEAMLPAATALVEELSGEAGVGHDLLDDLLPEYKGWTQADIDHFLATGERPAREYDGSIPTTAVEVHSPPEGFNVDDP